MSRAAICIKFREILELRTKYIELERQDALVDQESNKNQKLLSQLSAVAKEMQERVGIAQAQLDKSNLELTKLIKQSSDVENEKNQFVTTTRLSPKIREMKIENFQKSIEDIKIKILKAEEAKERAEKHFEETIKLASDAMRR